LLPSAAPPSGPLWLHEIKHDGFRIIACKDGPEVWAARRVCSQGSA